MCLRPRYTFTEIYFFKIVHFQKILKQQQNESKTPVTKHYLWESDRPFIDL